ncbi:unnamed protein product [Ceratitis capitata]|uniref:(Mediterranean fruit fly) hypothetical protein n=1 Tax=Ceratitis capitata TaxID=7213 RepID=A0A811V3E3_CERCA|nr:unnamed protein product [Ceratitis capitata]
MNVLTFWTINFMPQQRVTAAAKSRWRQFHVNELQLDHVVLSNNNNTSGIKFTVPAVGTELVHVTQIVFVYRVPDMQLLQALKDRSGYTNASVSVSVAVGCWLLVVAVVEQLLW